MQATSISYCSKCLADFHDGEQVWYVVSDNNCVCLDCKSKIASSQIEPRRFLKNLSEIKKNPDLDTSAVTNVVLSKAKVQRLIEWFDFVEVEGFEVPIDRVILERLRESLDR
jgi:hypothetical protein